MVESVDRSRRGCRMTDLESASGSRVTQRIDCSVSSSGALKTISVGFHAEGSVSVVRERDHSISKEPADESFGIQDLLGHSSWNILAIRSTSSTVSSGKQSLLAFSRPRLPSVSSELGVSLPFLRGCLALVSRESFVGSRRKEVKFRSALGRRFPDS
jgi:hypothetical protein